MLPILDMLLWSGLDTAGLAPVDASLEVLSCAMQRPRELASAILSRL